MRLILLMIVVTFVLILVGGATLVGGIACFSSKDSGVRFVALGTAVVGACVTVLLIRCLIMLNRQWSVEFARRFDENAPELLAEWTVSPDQWAVLGEYERNESERDAPLVAAWTGSIFGGVAIFAFWSSLGAAKAAVLGCTVGAIAAAIGWLLERRSGARPYFGKISGTSSAVAIRTDGMLVGGIPIAWSGMYGSLSTFQCSSPSDLPFSILTVEVRRRTGENSVYHTYRIPLPAGQTELPETEQGSLAVGA